MSKQLSDYQKKILKAVYQYQIENNNWYPTFRDLQDKVGGTISTSTIGRNLEALQDSHDYVDMRDGKAAVRITARGFYYLKAHSIISQKSEMPHQAEKDK